MRIHWGEGWECAEVSVMIFIASLSSGPWLQQLLLSLLSTQYRPVHRLHTALPQSVIVPMARGQILNFHLFVILSA